MCSPSQQQLEKVAASMPDGTTSMQAKMVLRVEGTDFEHVVEGSIELAE